MRQLLLTVLGGLLAAATGRAQTAPAALPPAEPAMLIGTYQLTFRPDSTDPATRSEIMFLRLGKGLSKFESRGHQLLDSAQAANSSAPITQDNAEAYIAKLMALPSSRFSYVIYKTTAPRHIYHDEHIGMSSYRYEEPAGALPWTITPATTATIAGYACQRATATFGGRAWEAWFTREVPVSDGPYKFAGLPGLIVKVGDTRGHYVFELLKLRKPATEQLVAGPSKAPVVTDRTAFRRAAATFNLDPLAQLSAGAPDGVRFTILGPAGSQNPEAMEKRRRERLKKQNNPLELK